MFGDLAGECKSEAHQLKQLVVKMDYCKDRIQQAAEQEVKCQDPRYMRFDLPMKQQFLQNARNMQEKWTKKLQKYNHKYQDLLLQSLHRPQPASVQPSEACPLCLEDNEEVPLCANLGDYVNADGARQGHGVCTACLPSYLETGRNTCLMCREPYGDQWLTLRQQYGFEQDDVVMEDAWSSNLPLEFDNGMSPGSVYAMGAVVWSLNEEDYRFTGIAPSDPSALTIGRGRIGSSSLSMDFTPQLLYRIDFDVYGSHSVYRPAAEIALETTEVPPDPVDAQIRVFHSAIVLDDFLWSGTVLQRIPVATPTAFYLVALHSYDTQAFLFFMLASSRSIRDGLHPEVLHIHQEASAQGPQVSQSHAFPFSRLASSNSIRDGLHGEASAQGPRVSQSHAFPTVTPTWCAPNQPLVVEDSKSWRLPVWTWKRGKNETEGPEAENGEEVKFPHRAGLAELLTLYHLGIDNSDRAVKRGMHQQIVHYLLELLAPSKINPPHILKCMNIEYGNQTYRDVDRKNATEIENLMEPPFKIRDFADLHWVFKIPRNETRDFYDGTGMDPDTSNLSYSNLFNHTFERMFLQLIQNIKHEVGGTHADSADKAVQAARKFKLVFYCLSTTLCLRIVESMRVEKNPGSHSASSIRARDTSHGWVINVFVNILSRACTEIRTTTWPDNCNGRRCEKRSNIKKFIEDNLLPEANNLINACNALWKPNGARKESPPGVKIPLESHFSVTNLDSEDASPNFKQQECKILNVKIGSDLKPVGYLDLVPGISVSDANVLDQINSILITVNTAGAGAPVNMETFARYMARTRKGLVDKRDLNQILAKGIAGINTFLDDPNFLNEVTKAIYDNNFAQLSSKTGRDSFSFCNYIDDKMYKDYLPRYTAKIASRNATAAGGSEPATRAGAEEGAAGGSEPATRAGAAGGSEAAAGVSTEAGAAAHSSWASAVTSTPPRTTPGATPPRTTPAATPPGATPSGTTPGATPPGTTPRRGRRGRRGDH
tara:strand:+ start:15903 stop:18893 length:2991 start_codon:yes stop_codon:yes gene_type:complete